jgi:hypothetical protein
MILCLFLVAKLTYPMSINHWLWGICVNVLKWIFNRNCRKNMGRERANLFLKCHSLQKSKSNLIPNFQQTNKIIMRKVYKTITLPIYYSLYHDKISTVNTLLYAQLLYEIISLQNSIMSKKRTFTYIPTLFF